MFINVTVGIHGLCVVMTPIYSYDMVAGYDSNSVFYNIYGIYI